MKLPFFKKKETVQQPSVQVGYQPQNQPVAGQAIPQQQQEVVSQTPRYRGAAPVASNYTVVPPAYDTQIKKSFLKGKLIWFILGLLFLLLIGAAIFLWFLIPKNSIVIEDQPVGDTITVKKLSLAKDGYLVLSFGNNFGIPGIPLAISELLPADTYKDIKVEFLKLEGRNSRDPKPSDIIVAEVFEETNGNRFYQRNDDTPAKTLFGKRVVKKIKLQ